MTTRRIKSIRKSLVVFTKSQVLDEEPVYEDFPMRSWSVELLGFKQEDISAYIQKVEYKLHESFENPTREFETFPYMLQEKGWGQFEMEIVVHFKDNSASPVSIKHHLLFDPEKYEKTYSVLHWQNVRPNSAESAVLFGASNEEEKENEPSSLADDGKTPNLKKRKRREMKVTNVPKEFSMDDLLFLADKLKELTGEDILKVVDLIEAFSTVANGKARVDKSKEDMYIFQLDSLNADELSELWVYCANALKRIKPGDF